MKNIFSIGLNKLIAGISRLFLYFSDDSEVARIEHNPQTGEVRFFDCEGGYLYSEYLKEGQYAWPTMDPRSEKYPWLSPYVFCLNNPIRFIDPNGEDVYRYDDETGEMILVQETDDDYDQIGRFKYDRKTDTYTLKTKKDGTAKTRMDNIEKGILSDGMNFLSEDNMIAVGGEGQATVEGFQDFIIGFSDMIDKEIGGYYLIEPGKTDVSQIYVGRHEKNDARTAYKGGGPYILRPDLIGTNLEVNTSYHTHLGRFDVLSRTTASDQDKKSKANDIKNGVKRFIVLTPGFSPIEY